LKSLLPFATNFILCSAIITHTDLLKLSFVRRRLHLNLQIKNVFVFIWISDERQLCKQLNEEKRFFFTHTSAALIIPLAMPLPPLNQYFTYYEFLASYFKMKMDALFK
jgi:hypothetical protein